MLPSFEFNGKRFQKLPEPVTAEVKPDVARRLPSIPSHRVISVIGVRQEDMLVLFSKEGENISLYAGHLVNPPEEWLKKK